LLTCKQFLQELNDYLEDILDPTTKAELQRHVNECPNCWVVCDTTQRTLRIYKGLDVQPLPEKVHTRLMQALQSRMAERCSKTPKAG
jgi:anti-sigma factor RsiW